MAGEKRSQDYEDARDEKIIIVDIEGTTTSISFVKDTLFPYVRNNLKDYIEKNWENAEFKEDVKKLKEMATKDEADKIEGFVPITDSTTDEEKESLMKNILWQMDNDRKSGGLKQLQGHMWRDAYKSGAVKGHVYEDVPKSLEAWTKDNRKIYVYSSGSVEAQKLLFENTENGSLLKYFTDYYDTEIGEKQQTSSYKNILTKIDTEGKNVLFLTDVTKEAQAAIDAGMSSIIVIREGNAELTSEEKNKFTTIKSFDDLSFKTSAKRVKIDDTIEVEKNDTKVVTDEAKKTDKVETKTTTTTTDVEMKDVSTSNVEKNENKEDDKPKEEPMQVETEITKVDDDVVTKKEEEKEVKKNDTSVVKNDTSVVKTDEKIEKKNDKIEEPVVKASTSEVKSIEKETTTTTTTPTKKITTEETTKKDTVVVDDDKKIDENTQVQKKSETTSQKSTEENKSDKIEKTNEKIIVEAEETKTKTEIEVKKIEVEKTNNDTTVKTVETTKTEETNDKKDKKDDDIVEKVKNTDEKISDKPITEEVKQNGDSKKSTDKNETTTTTTTTTTTPTVTVTETKVPETTKVTNGQKTELNGDSKKVELIEKKETEVKVASVNNETTSTTTTKTDDEPAKIESAKKEEDEKPKNDDEKQRVNGNTDDKNDKTHQNGVNEEKSKNGESSTDTETFKVKKVVEIIADGAGEAEVAPPVAVVAATS
ncbi:hypothetical protein HCN44_000617 [Aphidius gifuensis]|uniref:Enolase-phosphatase E1 n=1 Tax=Aphidius gifuensis TaxID=684658 RepID=A0A835CP09_APHGI|nr:enolase-phosphatase E1-like [Aphidius gifuensis]KAF7990812.1 hypothetical protein HCN44_000617 [Aphidius gifuensis]